MTGLVGAGGQWYENTWICPEDAEITMAIQEAFDALEAGTTEHLLPNPFYLPPDGLQPLTDAQIEHFIEALDEEYDKEINSYASHHRTRSGAEAKTELHRLPWNARRWLAEQIETITVKHRHIDQNPPPREIPSDPRQTPPWTGE